MKLMVRHVIHRLISRTPDVPAAAALKLLLAEEFGGESGALFSMVGKFKRLPLPRNLQNREEGERLWALSEALAQSALGQTALASAPSLQAS